MAARRWRTPAAAGSSSSGSGSAAVESTAMLTEEQLHKLAGPPNELDDLLRPSSPDTLAVLEGADHRTLTRSNPPAAAAHKRHAQHDGTLEDSAAAAPPLVAPKRTRVFATALHALVAASDKVRASPTLGRAVGGTAKEGFCSRRACASP